ncbi:MAG TPA: ABC transporter permease [Bacteroidota bacterium]|nr:ABC transporter permease [Bacteroidota bacterium]
MKKKLAIAKWEFVEKVKTRAFLISLILTPVIMVVFGVVPGLFASKPDDRPVIIGIIDETNSIVEPLSKRLEEKYKLPSGEPNYIVRNLTAEGLPEQIRAIANKMIADDVIEGYFYIPSTVFDSGKVEYRAENVGNFRVQERFSRTIEEVVVEKRALSQGYDPAVLRRLMADIDVKSIKVTGEGEEKESSFLETFFSSYIIIMMLMFLVLTSGQLLIRSVVEEKSNRLIEILMSSCSANDLMVGKIIGLSGLGIVQVLLWAGMAFAISAKFGTSLFQVETFFIALIYFILGYLLYAAIFVAAGSPVTTEQEAQQITSYVSLALVFPIVLAIPIMQNPDSTLVKVLSFIPIFTPSFMVMRLPIQMPALWEIVGTIAVLILSVWGMMWVAGKIFRTAILVYGKRPTLSELYRWLRAA